MSALGETFEVKSWFGPKVVISASAIEITRNGQAQTYPRSFIKGFRSYTNRGVAYFTLELMNEPKPVRFNISSSRAGQVRTALGDLPDLDQVDKRANEDAIRQDVAYGATPEERWQTLQNEKRLALVVNVAGGLIAAWAGIFPNPYALSVIACAAVAPLAIALTYAKQARWYLIPRKNDPHPSAAIAIGTTAVALGFRALIDRDVLDWSQLWLIAAAGGVMLTAAALSLFNANQLKNWWAAFVGVAFFYGVITQADALLDNAPSEFFQTRVVDTHVSHGRSTSYSATLGPWGPETGLNNHSISRELYNHLSSGGQACVVLHPGALHLRWFVINDCYAYDTSSLDKGK